MQLNVSDGLDAFLPHTLLIEQSKTKNTPEYWLPADKDIAGNRHHRNHGVVLVYCLDPEPHRVLRRANMRRRSIDEDFALILPVHARQDFNQCRLSSSVIANKANRFTLGNL